MTRIQRCICEIYSRVQLKSVGFCFGKCAKDKKITLLAMDTLEELLNEMPRRIIIILPNQDLSSPDYTITNDRNVDSSYKNLSIEQLGHNRYNRLVIRRYSQTQLNSRQESSNEFDIYLYIYILIIIKICTITIWDEREIGSVFLMIILIESNVMVILIKILSIAAVNLVLHQN